MLKLLEKKMFHRLIHTCILLRAAVIFPSRYNILGSRILLIQRFFYPPFKIPHKSWLQSLEKGGKSLRLELLLLRLSYPM